MKDIDVDTVDIPVVGGHAGTTIVPLLSQATPGGCGDFEKATYDALVHRIMFGGDEVVQAKAGGGSATLSMAYAGEIFANTCLQALDGQAPTACTFVESPVTDAPFFSSRVTLGKDGVDTIHGLGEITETEQELVDAMLPDLIAQAAKGVAFVKK
jgi:malate dehydrogenase